MNEIVCNNCKFFVPNFTGDLQEIHHQGECRRYAPKGINQQNNHLGRPFPVVIGNYHWCGEFSAKNTPFPWHRVPVRFRRVANELARQDRRTGTISCNDLVDIGMDRFFNERHIGLGTVQKVAVVLAELGFPQWEIELGSLTQDT